MKRKIAIFTGSRAEYGLLYWLLKDISTSKFLELQIIVSGMHLSPEFGSTWQQIVKDGFQIDEKVEMLLSSDSPIGVVKSIGLGVIGFSEALARLRPDGLVVLGDRFEAFAIAQTALIMRIPVIHLHGGEITEGAYDDQLRHSITKIASWHFVAAEEYRSRVIQMGEDPGRVFNVGAIGLDHISKSPLLSIDELSRCLKFDLCAPYFLVTYHPSTMGDEDPAFAFSALLEALNGFPDYKVIITYPNADNGGRKIIGMLETYALSRPDKVLVTKSLGQINYLSALRGARAVIGNSSSGIVEAPAMGIPTVNIGTRQNGRLFADSILHCAADAPSISESIMIAVSDDFSAHCRNVTNPYGSGDVAQKIISALETVNLSVHKRFYDLPRRT